VAAAMPLAPPVTMMRFPRSSMSEVPLALHATVRIEIPLPPRVRLANDPSATTVTLLRGTPTTINTPSLQPVFMYDGRDSTLEEQALGAVHAHARNGVEPSALQLQLLAEFQRTSPRFFSSLPLFLFARGGPPPRLPTGVTASEKRGRAMFDDVPITADGRSSVCGVCERRLVRACSPRA